MKKTVKKRPTVGLVCLGCAKNMVDLQVMTGYLLKDGFKLVATSDEADVVFVNTCAFIESARREANREIRRVCKLKAAGAVKRVIVTGCLPQRYGAASLAKKYPLVDAFLGIDQLDRAAEVARKPETIEPFTCTRVFEPPMPAFRLSGPAYAYLKIAEGCAHRCSYCAIPGIRGTVRSRPLESIVAEARALLETGVRELNIVAQDPLLWGVDLEGRPHIEDLLEALDLLEGDFWIRVLYAYPSEITDRLLTWLATARHAAKYLDVPLQHTDPKVLKLMARGAATEATITAAARIRAAVPGVTLRTTVMTGFPGETQESFNKLLADVKRMKFDYLSGFVFSPEEGTVAAELPDCPDRAVAEKRLNKILKAQDRIWCEKASELLGKVVRVLVVAPGVARMESQAPEVDGLVQIPTTLSVGTFAHVRLTMVLDSDFVGEIP